MPDTKKQNFLYKQQQQLLTIVDGIEELKTMRGEYDALDYGNTIDPGDLDDSVLAGWDPQVFEDTWTAVDAFYAVLQTYKTPLYKALP